MKASHSNQTRLRAGACAAAIAWIALGCATELRRASEPAMPKLSTSAPSSDATLVRADVGARSESSPKLHRFASGDAPTYPEKARRHGEEGTVALRIDLAYDGRIRKVDVVESSGHELLDQAALLAVQSWRFQPQTENTNDELLTHRIEFRLIGAR